MNLKLAHLLTRLYPRPWQERYGAEFETHLQTGPGDLRTTANVVRAAICEHLIPTQTLASDHGRNPLQSLCVRAPWAMFIFAPLLLLAAVYFVACLYLWSGWNIFMPGADSPFGRPVHGPIYGLQNIYFQAGKFYYLGAPILVGWVIALIATRQKVKAAWPIIGLVLIAWMGANARIQASRIIVPHGLGHISLKFDFGTSLQHTDNLHYAIVILFSTMVPYFILMRFKKTANLSA